MVTGHITIGYRGGNPVDIQAQQIEQFTAHDGDFSGIDAIGAEYRTAATLGALKQVVPPFFKDIQGHGSGTGKTSQDLADLGEVVAVDTA